MYQAKERRTGHWVYRADGDSSEGQDRLRTLEELREAVYSRGLTVYYQPKVDSRTSVVRGVEALVRWNHPTRGLLYPAAFLPLAEDSGLMRELTTCVLEQSMDQVVQWRREGRSLSVAVNLSASSLVDLELPDRICSILFSRNLPSEILELEITEDFLMGDRERAREILTQLRGLGIRVAVDDFGTGYSSLAYLRELPIDELKLDRSFVQPMSEDPRAAAIVRSTIGLAHSLGMTLVAEGVEDEATANHLALSGCDASQGYYYARPLPSHRPRDLARPARAEAAVDAGQQSRWWCHEPRGGDRSVTMLPVASSNVASRHYRSSGSSAVVQGLGPLQALGDDLDALTDACSAPATAGRAWVFATIAASSDARPWAVIVRGVAR